MPPLHHRDDPADVRVGRPLPLRRLRRRFPLPRPQGRRRGEAQPSRDAAQLGRPAVVRLVERDAVDVRAVGSIAFVAVDAIDGIGGVRDAVDAIDAIAGLDGLGGGGRVRFFFGHDGTGLLAQLTSLVHLLPTGTGCCCSKYYNLQQAYHANKWYCIFMCRLPSRLPSRSRHMKITCLGVPLIWT